MIGPEVPQPEPEPEIKSCLGCGRDTRAKDGICFRCRAAKPSRGNEESRGRKSLPPAISGLLDDDEDDE